MKRVFYEKVGRRYVPVSMHDGDLYTALPVGTHLIVKVDPGMTTTVRNIDPGRELAVAVMVVIRSKLIEALSRELDIRPGRNAAPTKLEKAVFAELQERLPSRIVAHRQNISDAVMAAIKTVEETIYDFTKDRERTDTAAF